MNRKKMTIDCSADTFYNKVIDKFTKTKRGTEWIHKKFLITHLVIFFHKKYLLLSSLPGYYSWEWGHQIHWRVVSSLKQGLLVEVYFLTVKLVHITLPDVERQIIFLGFSFILSILVSKILFYSLWLDV